MASKQKQDKLDKRASALRDNLKKRKEKKKATKTEAKRTKDK